MAVLCVIITGSQDPAWGRFLVCFSPRPRYPRLTFYFLSCHAFSDLSYIASKSILPLAL